MNDLVPAKLKEIINLQNFLKQDELQCERKRRKVYSFSEYSLRIIF